MKKLIEEKEVAHEAWELADGTYGTAHELYRERIGFKRGFVFGSESAESKLHPMMIEFAEWCERHHTNSTEGWVDKFTMSHKSTTEQLLEQFLNRRK